jgi:hypothetical protein
VRVASRLAAGAIAGALIAVMTFDRSRAA